jgi:hypothetical protein
MMAGSFSGYIMVYIVSHKMSAGQENGVSRWLLVEVFGIGKKPPTRSG